MDFQKIYEGTWALKTSEKNDAVKKIEELKDYLYGKFGDDILFDHLDAAIGRIEELVAENPDRIYEEKVVVVRDDDKLRVQKVGDEDHFVRFPKKLRKKVGQKFDVENLTFNGKNYTASGEILEEDAFEKKTTATFDRFEESVYEKFPGAERLLENGIFFYFDDADHVASYDTRKGVGYGDFLV